MQSDNAENCYSIKPIRSSEARTAAVECTEYLTLLSVMK